jgi:hypothetical protein
MGGLGRAEVEQMAAQGRSLEELLAVVTSYDLRRETDTGAALVFQAGLIPSSQYAHGKVENWARRPWKISDEPAKLSKAP